MTVYKNQSYKDLIDICTTKRRENSTRMENAKFFLEQIKNPTMFRVGEDVVELEFLEENITLSNCISKILSSSL